VLTHSPMALSHLKFRHLMLIVHLAQFGTLHKAARHLSISQPAATAMLSDLEALIGFPLFNRSHRGVVLTPQGKAILESAQTLLNEFGDFTTTLGRVAQGRERMLRMGVVPQAFAAYLPQAIERFRAEGGCAVKAQEGTARQLLSLLWDGLLDCVIGRLPSEGLPEGHDPSALSFVSLYEEDICVVVGAQQNRVQPTPQTFEDLLACEWVLQRRDSSVRRAFSEAFLRQGLQAPEPVVETTNYVQSLAIVSNSGFCTVAPKRAAELQQALGVVTVLDFQLNIAPMQVGFITRSVSASDGLVVLFRDCFVHVVRAADPPPLAPEKQRRRAIPASERRPP